MLFNSLYFVFFLCFSVFLLFVVKTKQKRIILLLLNIFFYSCSNPYNIIIIFIIGIISYLFSFILFKYKNKAIAFITITISIFPLILYKYSNFLLNSILNINVSINLSNIIPLGLSFITVQIVGYLIDIYKGSCEPEKNILNYFIFISFFPIVTCGPIERSASLLPQIKNLDKATFNYKGIVEGCRIILFGYLLKVFIAERLANIINIVYSDINSSSGLILLVTTFLFTIQIYCDFCGYSYIALGSAKLMGIKLIQNFNKSYISQSITEFWTRWHISLSSWLKDYIYIPLGGNRCSKARNYINILIVFFVSGLWHGASFTYILWGIFNGLIIVLERITKLNKKSTKKSVKILKTAYTFLVVNFLWIFFRANTIFEAILIIKKIFTESIHDLSLLTSFSSIIQYLRNYNLSVLYCLIASIALIIFFIYSIIIKNYNLPSEIINNKPFIFRWFIYILLIFIILTLGATVGHNQFIYANF